MEQDIQQKTAELLAQLHDVQVPASSWWPPAPGWWVVIALALALIVVTVCWAHSRSKNLQWVAVAQAELLVLETAFKSKEISAQEAVSRLSVLMRRSAMAALGRKQVARATDEQWIQVLSKVSDGQGFDREAALKLVSAPYSGRPLADSEVVELFGNCGTWLHAARSIRRAADV